MDDIGIDEFDELDDILTPDNLDGGDVSPDLNTGQDGSQEPPINKDDDFIERILKDRGITDKSKIKFENEEGVVEEVNWDNLSNSDKYNILNNSVIDDNTSLDDSEIDLINAIRNSGLTPAEYIKHIENNVVNRYILNSQNPSYSVDLYNDDELFVSDLMSRMEDITEEEALEALNLAKSNESLFKKLITALRNEYKLLEDENLQQALFEQEQEAQAKFALFSQSVVDQINDFTEVSGYDLNMNNDDMQMLYDFITGNDAAGNNHFAKALSDPKTLVKTAWFALNGEQMIQDITEYFLREITKVREDSFKKGVESTKGVKSDIVYKNKSEETFNAPDDLDNF